MADIWAIADLHLALSCPNKTMACFGEPWVDYVDKIQRQWVNSVCEDDLVLLPGDISWALHFEQALIDLQWIDELPGHKLILKGNHDYWWPSVTKLKNRLPKSIAFIQNNVFNFGSVSIGGSRLFDSQEINSAPCINFTPGKPPPPPFTQEEQQHNEKIYRRELGRLEVSLSQLSPKATCRIAMTHYPPISPNLNASTTSNLLERHCVHICVFGHLHSVKKDLTIYGQHNGICYHLVAADYLRFCPKKIYPHPPISSS